MFEAAASELMAYPDPHPESATRIENMRSILERGPLADRITWRAGRHTGIEELELVHTPEYVDTGRPSSVKRPVEHEPQPWTV